MEIQNLRYSSDNQRGKRPRLIRIFSFCLVFIFILGLGVYTYAATAKPLPALSIVTDVIQPVAAQTVTLPWPVGSEAAIGSLNDGILAQSATAEVPRPIASMAKVITALAVMKQKPFSMGASGDVITLDSVDVSYYNSFVAKGGSVVPVAVGEKLTQLQALQALLLPSGNNIADSLARWAFGSTDAYVSYANSMVKNIGLTSTVIADASGFSSGTVSTPSEMIIIARLALSDPIISGIVDDKEAIIPVAGIIRNTNQLISSGASGIKTGFTYAAGYCLLFAAKHQVDADHSETVIGVIMNGSSMQTVFQSADKLLSATYAGFGTREVVKSGTKIGSYTNEWNKPVILLAESSLAHYGWLGRELTAEIDINVSSAPISKGFRAGTVKVKSEPKSSVIQIITESGLTEPSLLWRLGNYF